MKHKNIIILFSFISATIALSLFFINPLLSRGLEYLIKDHCRSFLDADFTAEKIESDNDGWVIIHPRVQGTKPISEGGMLFTAEQIKIRPRRSLLSLFVRKLDVEITFEEPHLQIKRQSSDISQLLTTSYTPISLVSLTLKTIVKQGSIRFYQTAQPDDAFQDIYYQIDAEVLPRKRGTLVASLDDPALKTNCIVLALEQIDRRHLAIDFDFDGVHCRSLVAAAANIFPALNDVNASEGIIKGKLALTIPKEGSVYAAGDLSFHNIAFDVNSMELKGRIDEAHLHLEESGYKNPKEKAGSSPSKEPRTIGNLDLTKGAVLDFQRNGIPYCKIQDLAGAAYFQTQNSARIVLDGVCEYQNQVSSLHIEGDTRFPDETQGSLELSLRLLSPENKVTEASFITRQLGSKFKFANIQFANMGSGEFDLLKTALTPYFPELSKATMDSGRIDASALAYMQGLRITDLKIEKIAASNLHFQIPPWGLALEVGELAGDFAINLTSESILETLNADLMITNGQLEFPGMGLGSGRLRDLQTRLAIRKGVVLKSIVTGKFAGLEGIIHLDAGALDGEVVKLNFTGGTEGLAAVSPELVQKALREHFMEDVLSVRAGVRMNGHGVKLEGSLNFKKERERYGQTIEFGFDIHRTSQQLWGKWPIQRQMTSFWQNIGPQVFGLALPGIATPLAYLQSRWFKKELGIAGFVLNNGWFQAQNLPLEKYAAPLLVKNEGVSLTGQGDFHGTFDHEKIALAYDVNNFLLESRVLAIDVKTLHDSEDRNPMAPMPGVHYIDMASGKHYGVVPVTHGSFLDKKSGLLFTDVKSTIIFEGDKIHLTDLATACCGINFSGALDVDMSKSEQGIFNVDIHAEAAQGKFSQLQHLFSNFEKLAFFEKFPLEGEISLREEGAGMALLFHPDKVTLSSHINGTLLDGSIGNRLSGISAKKMSLNFVYDHDAKTFDITDINGVLVSGKGPNSEEYIVSGDKIRFTDCTRNEAEFDLWVGNNKRDIVRIAGKTASSHLEGNEGFIEFILDNNATHFGNIYPKSFELIMRNWTQPERFHIEFGLSLTSIFHDLKSVGSTGIAFFSPQWQQQLNKLESASGEFDVILDYEAKNSLLTYNAIGHGVSFGNFAFEKCSLQGKKKDSVWAIDQLLLDDISLAADVVRVSDVWKVNFLGVRVGESLLMGLEGEYRDGDGTFDTKVNLLEVNMSKLREWPALHEFVSACHPEGYLRASGQMRLESSKRHPGDWKIDAVLNAALRSWEFKGMALQDALNVSCHYVSDRGVTLRQLKTALKSPEDDGFLAAFNMEKIDYDFAKKEIVLEGMHFNAPALHLQHAMEILSASFPEAFTAGLVESVIGLKRDGSLIGTLNMIKSSDQTLFQASVKNDTYRFKGHEYKVSDFTLEYDLNELKIAAKYFFNEYPLWVKVKSHPPHFDTGVMVIQELMHQHEVPSHTNSMTINWKVHPVYGFWVQKAKGQFAGLDADLAANHDLPLSRDAVHLAGTIRVNPVRAARLLSENLQMKAIAWQFGPGYTMKGKIRFGKEEAEVPQVHFHGVLEGSDFFFKGYQFNKMSARLDYVPGSLELHDLNIDDASGQFRIASALFYMDGTENWFIEIPSIKAVNFKPSFLRDAGTPPVQIGKPLVVRELEVENIIGNVNYPESITGKGKLHFINPPKKNLQNTILAIPAEILTRIGLDLTVLNPVSGTIFYDIHDGKVFLSKFKDVYSEGRLSKFHLSSTSSPSYVDFDGNLNVKIRMKQYNIFFKLAELFTVSVQGTLLGPTYSLKKQQE